MAQTVPSYWPDFERPRPSEYWRDSSYKNLLRLDDGELRRLEQVVQRELNALALKDAPIQTHKAKEQRDLVVQRLLDKQAPLLSGKRWCGRLPSGWLDDRAECLRQLVGRVSRKMRRMSRKHTLSSKATIQAESDRSKTQAHEDAVQGIEVEAVGTQQGERTVAHTGRSQTRCQSPEPLDNARRSFVDMVMFQIVDEDGSGKDDYFGPDLLVEEGTGRKRRSLEPRDLIFERFLAHIESYGFEKDRYCLQWLDKATGSRLTVLNDHHWVCAVNRQQFQSTDNKITFYVCSKE